MPTPKHPPMNSDRPEQAASTGKPQTPIYDSPTTKNVQPVQASFTGQERPTTNDQRLTTNDQRTTNNASYVDPDEINLLDYLRVIYKYKWMIIVMTIIAMAATVAYSLQQPRMYQASASIVPPIDRLSQGGGLAAKLGGAGSMLLQGMLNEGNLSSLYVGILESRTVSEALIDRFDLINVYENVKTRTHARKRLGLATHIKASKEGIVHITIKDRDPNRAAAIANAYVEELDTQNKHLSGGQATSKRIFLENRLEEIQSELSKIESLQSREVQIKEMLLELLSRECEIAKIEEANSMPTIQVLDQAIVPEGPVGRGTVKKGILTGILAMMLGIFIAFGREYVQGIKTTAAALNSCQP